MKMKYSILVVLVSCIFFSCPETRTRIEYSKCFFLGEKSFVFEAEYYYSSPLTFDTVFVKPYEVLSIAPDEWKIYGEKISENRIRIPIDITSNGITLEKEVIGSKFSHLFPEGFPVMYLDFRVDDNWPIFPKYKEIRHNHNYLYSCNYVFVAEPIDLSGTITGEAQDMFGHYNYIHHNDLKFSTPGWYKIISGYHSKIGNDAKYSSTVNNYFY